MSGRPELHIVTSEPPPKPALRTRPATMFQFPQETGLGPQRDKLLFIEAMMASDNLTLRELRVGVVLVTSYSTAHGCAFPSMQYIADATGIHKRHAGKVLKSLEAKGWFIVDHGTRGRGRKNHANRYRPNVEKVLSAAPFKTAALASAEQRAKSEKVPSRSQKVPSASAKGASRGTLYGSSLPGAIADTAAYAAPRDTRDGLPDHDSPNFVILKKLESIHTWIKAGADRAPSDAERRTLRQLYVWCDEVHDMYDGHTGDPIGGFAGRLAGELSYLLGHNV